MFTRLYALPTEKLSVFLFGPRGTGKTTWLKDQIAAEVYIDLLKSDEFIRFSSRPASIEEIIPPGYKDWVVIDEIQRVPALLHEVHRLIEAKKYRFILTGSSARSLRKKGVNLLAGRAVTSHLYPMTAMELKDSFSLERAVRYGHLPTVCTDMNENEYKAYLSSYVQTYIQQEVLQEGLTRNIGAFARFLETASFSHGSVINYSEVAREVGQHRKVVESYFSILEDLLLGWMLPVFRKRAKRNMSVHPKFYFFDTGIYQILRPRGPLDSYSEISGAAIEGLLIQEIRACNEYYLSGYELFYWRTSTNIEVDLVLYGEHGLKAFEVKHADHIRDRDLRGLETFGFDYPEAQLYLIYRGTRKEYHGRITVLPITWALTHMPELLAPEPLQNTVSDSAVSDPVN
ncbi:MAG: ATP-binding protein [Spirochaetia bacterium]|nr:ATP-binding protein [Spirochaetia bacterium]